MSVSRREFVRLSCCSAAAAVFVTGIGNFGLINAFAQGVSHYKALVCIFLFGGNDGNNMLMPFDTTGFQNYTNVRGALALAQNTVLPINTATGNTPFSLHPQLGAWQQMFNNKQLAFLANVGTLVAPLTRTEYQKRQKAVPLNLFSHSDQQREWQTSFPQEVGTSGWAGRISDRVSALNSPATFPTITSVAGNNILNVGINTRPVTINPGQTFGFGRFDTSAVSEARKTSAQELLTFDSGVTLVQSAGGVYADAWKNSKLLNDALATAPALATVFPTTGIGRQLQQVARILQVRGALSMKRQIFFCSLGGFDTHTNQLGDQGNLFSQLGPAMGAFFQATGELGIASGVTTFTLSDFGRTFAPASGAGSDHA
jgi:uncharacterized protein (DUF1501 family)